MPVFLLLVASQVKCQNYDYAVEEGEDHSDFTDDGEHSAHPDYSKYYSVDNSAPLLSTSQNPESSGFVSPIEFSSFFGPSPIAFGASSPQQVTKPSTGFVQQESKISPLDALKQEFGHYSNDFPRDFFEESQRKQQLEKQNEEKAEESSSELKPGPNYISHQVPLQYNSEDEEASNVEEVEEVTVKPTKKPKHKKYESKPKDEYEEETPGKYSSPDYSSFDGPVNHNKYTDYNTGKSSSTVSQYPTAAGLPEKQQYLPKSTLSPYEKFSFQPQQSNDNYGFKPLPLDTLISTVAPFNPAYAKVANTEKTPVYEGQSSESVPSNLKGCRKIKKAVSEAEAMNCYVCDDPGTKSKYTHCSYSSEPEPVSHYSGKSERYSTPAREPDGFRYKRYSDDDAYNADPYTYIKDRSEKLYNEPAETEKDEYHYSPDYYTEETHPEKSYSELESEEIKKHPENCKKIDKDGMTCTICKNPKTGGNYEQCSYTSAPKEQKYAYVTNKKYDSDSEQPEESQPVAQTKPVSKTEQKKPLEFGKKISTRDYEPIEEYEGRRKNNKRPERNDRGSSKRRNEEGRSKQKDDVDSDVYHRLEESKPQQFKSRDKSHKNEDDVDDHGHYHHHRPRNNNKKSEKLVQDDPYEIPQHFAESTSKEHKRGGSGLDPTLYGNHEDSSENVETTEKSKYKDIDEYHFKLFPEFANEESRQEEAHSAYPVVETSRQNVEEVLAEFSKKDRSNCKKAERNGMTCYLCVDKNNIQHEECMFVSDSQPKSSHVAYHEVQQIKNPPVQQEEPAETKPSPQTVPVDNKRKKFYKKVTTTAAPFNLESAASEEIDSIVEYKARKVAPKRKRNDKKPKSKKSKATQDVTSRLDDKADPTLETPTEFAVGDEEGAYSAETKPVYSKALGVKLPKYMLEKSEFEKEFDDFAGTF